MSTITDPNQLPEALALAEAQEARKVAGQAYRANPTDDALFAARNAASIALQQAQDAASIAAGRWALTPEGRLYHGRRELEKLEAQLAPLLERRTQLRHLIADLTA